MNEEELWAGRKHDNEMKERERVAKLERDLLHAREATVPVAEWCMLTLNAFDDEIRRVEKDARYQEQTSRASVPLYQVTGRITQALVEMRETIANLPGWTGEERDCLKMDQVDKARAEASAVRAAASKCLAAHEDIGCSCDGCMALRRVLATSKAAE